MLILVQ